MKKVLSVIAAISIVVASWAVPVMADAAFTDMAADHWAMQSVSRLVSDGTINGFPDGTFRPTGIVSRAEFVKMLGKSDIKFDKDFLDVPKDHWAYDYIMHSALDGDANGNFNPTAPITRGQVAELLYKRYAGGAETIAPNYVTNGASDTKAAAWAYNTGLMVGGDMLNLRLADSLTRAEAAVLIVRAKDLNPTAYRSFIDNFSDDVYKNVYENSNLFLTGYSPDENITYEELSVAAMRFENKYKNSALNYIFEPKYEGEYAKHWDVICTYALDEKGFTSAEAEAKGYATVENAIAILTLAARNNQFIESNMVKTDGRTYSEVTIKDSSSQFAKNMSYAYNFGISLYADGKINPQKLITKKEVSCILMQYSLTFGAQIAYHCGYNSGYMPLTARMDSASYPANKDFYSAVLQEIPNGVYDAAYKLDSEVSIAPKSFINSAVMYGNMYATAAMSICAAAYEKGAELYIDVYPSLIMRLQSRDEIMRVRVSLASAPAAMKLSDFFRLGEGVEDTIIKPGDSFWCDLSTNQNSSAVIYLDDSLITLDQIIR